MICAALVALALSPLQAPAIQDSVSALLERHLPGTAEPVRRRYADGLVAALANASPGQRSRVLSGLDQAVGYHVSRLDFQLRRYRRVDLPADFVREGWDLEFDYLTQRVLRAGRNEWTDPSRQAAVRQIDDLAATMRSALGDRLLGEAGRDYVAKEAEAARQAWTGSLDRPFNRFVDEPLTPEQLERVKAGILAAVAGFSPIELKASDAASRDRLVELGVLQLMSDAKEAGFLASRQCFAEFRGPEGRCEDWKARLEKRYGEARVAAAGEAFAALEKERDKDDPEDEIPTASSKARTPVAAEAESSEVRVTAAKPAPAIPESTSSLRMAALAAAIAILVAYAGWMAWRWSRRS